MVAVYITARLQTTTRTPTEPDTVVVHDGSDGVTVYVTTESRTCGTTAWAEDSAAEVAAALAAAFKEEQEQEQDPEPAAGYTPQRQTLPECRRETPAHRTHREPPGLCSPRPFALLAA